MWKWEYGGQTASYMGIFDWAGQPWLPCCYYNDQLYPIGWLPWWLRQRICLQCRRPRFHPWVRKIPWRREIMYQSESWTIKTTQHQRIDALNCGVGEDSRVPWTARRSNQSILKEINLEYSLEGLMLKLKFHHFDHLMGRTDWLGKNLMLAKIKGRRRRGWQRIKWFDGITDLMDLSLNNLQEILKGKEAWSATVHGVAKNQTWLSDKTTTIFYSLYILWDIFFIHSSVDG